MKMIDCLRMVFVFASLSTMMQMPTTIAQEAAAPKTKVVDRQAMIDKAVDFLRVRGQAEDGSFSKQSGLGVTALVTAGLLAADVSREDPMVAKSLKYLESYRQNDGGIYAPNSKHSNYETCLSIMALVKANKDGRYTELLKGAETYIKKMQWDEGEGLKSDDTAFGGAGYGSKSRPDLSNTSFLLDALNSLGRDGNDEAVKRALVFVSRCQNRASGDNSTPFAAKVDDGGFYYTPAAGGDSMAGKTENGGLRSYASMTYAGLKSMIYAGVNKDDPRVQAAKTFLAQNYSLTSNPGMGTSGLYYYYQTMAKALSALGTDTFETLDGSKSWKLDILTTLADAQKEDGSWVNSDPRWLEGDTNLVTGYTLLTLSLLK
ncbi:MAG: terpene cyclase/mutase family protein [Planctomycetota bacterium]|nr:terpene cyclase/mutase family protein [Planctomycetota bacterium]